MANHPNRSKYKIGYYTDTLRGKEFVVLKTMSSKTDTEVESNVDGLFSATPVDDEGFARPGLYIRRGKVSWFCRFSHHLYAAHPKRAVGQ